MDLFFYARGSLRAGLVHQELHILAHEFLNLAVARDSGLEFRHLLGGNVAGDIAAMLIALMVIVRAFWSLAENADGAAVEPLDLGDVVEE